MRIAAIVIRILRQFRRDKRSLALMLFAPVLIVTLTWLVLDQDQGKLKIATIGVPDALTETLEGQDIEVFQLENPKDDLKDEEIDGILHIAGQQVTITVDDSNPSTSKAVLISIQKGLQTKGNKGFQFEINYLYDQIASTTFDAVGPVLIGFFAFFFVFLVGGISFLREKSQGTLDRILAMPIKGWEVISGYIIGFGLFAIIQSILVVCFAVFILDIPMEGSIFSVVLITLLLALSALTLGTLLSSFAKNEFQMMQFIPIVVVPQAFFSGMFSLEHLPNWLEWLEKVMPIHYGANALTEIMIKGDPISSVYMDVLILFVFSLLCFLLNLVTLRIYKNQ
ncbi:ABC transporter permease [Radiobacillus deserti]|uniref:ABC transporter permease n=1 Tax=Radiobacillus deserti TaxID=2594883 RepID=A0A516KCJ7_9BACI|nr:ABC transporter permease [Radiobacillus deserti]QDP39090.1 ABC transporter permease [Radiobacillus deserti]